MILDQDTEVVQEQEIVEQPQPEQAAAPAPQQEEQKHFRALRQSKEKAERERDEAIRVLREMEAARQQQPPQLDEDDSIQIGSDDIAEGKHLNKVTKKIKKLEEQITKYQKQSFEVAAETRVKTQYPDYDTVVSPDNIEILKTTYPELARTISGSNEDLYSKAVSAYTLIKKLGIHQEDTYLADKATAQRNAAKPRPLNSVSPQQGESPLSHANAFANGLTEDLKKQLYKEMQESRKRM